MIKGHGDDSYQYKENISSNFSSNVYNHIDLQGMKAHLCRQIDSIGSYPEPEPYTLESLLARKYRLDASEVCVTNGATEAIYLIAQAFRGMHSAVLQPTFSEYADACRMHGHRLQALYQLPDEREHFKLDEKIQLCWICNPNNPTGKVIDKAFLMRLMEENPGVCFVLDQSYEDFTRAALLTAQEGASIKNVLMLHSMTKRYAMPGLRLGFVTGNEDLLYQIRVKRMPWSVNELAIEAGIYLTTHPQEAPLDIVAYLQETSRLKAGLENLGVLNVWDTQTSFMLVQLRFGKARALKEFLAREHGILIRDASNFEGLNEQYFRISTQTPDENDRLIEAIAQWLQD